MALTKLDQLYRAVILDHSKNPRHMGHLDQVDATIELKNPTCGDLIGVELKLEEDVVKDVRFNGSGCTISMASASMMTEAVIGKSLDEVKALYQDFSNLVQGQEAKDEKGLGDAIMLQGVSKFPTRIRCATLSWKALNRAIETGGSGVDGQIKHEEIHDE